MSKSIIIFGFHAVQAQLDTNPESILNAFTFNQRFDKRLDSISNQFDALGIKTQKCSKQQLDKLTNNQIHQGIVAEISPPTLPNQNALMVYINKLVKLEKNSLLLILERVQDPRNLGACLRCANAAGVDCVIINKDGSAPINALAYKTAAGALNQLKIFQVTNLVRTIKALQAQNIWIIGLGSNVDNPDQQSLYQIDLNPPSAIVMGAEGFGLRKLTKQSCDQLAMIPMRGNIESLNVSVATGIALFEVNRQRYN